MDLQEVVPLIPQISYRIINWRFFNSIKKIGNYGKHDSIDASVLLYAYCKTSQSLPDAQPSSKPACYAVMIIIL